MERQLPALRSAYVHTAHEGGVLRCALALADNAVRHNRSVRRRLKHSKIIKLERGPRLPGH